MHATLSRFDMHNTLVAAGPDFRQGWTDETPSGNVDLAPTIAAILGLQPDEAMDGRVLSEAFREPPADAPLPGKPQTERLQASAPGRAGNVVPVSFPGKGRRNRLFRRGERSHGKITK